MSASDRKYESGGQAEALRSLARLEPLAAQVYVALLVLPGVDTADGWTGSRRQLAAKIDEATGKSKDRTRVIGLVNKIAALGLVSVEDHGNSVSVRLGSAPSQYADTGKRGIPVSPALGSPEVQTGSAPSHPGPLPPLHPPISSLHLDRSSQDTHASKAPRARDIRSRPGAIPVRNGKLVKEPVIGAADGLGAELRAAGLRFSDTQAEDMVRESTTPTISGSDEVRRQLAWLPRRDTSWITRTGGREAYFRKLCREHELEPINGDGGIKPLLSPDAVAALKADLRDRRVSKGAVARALASVGAPDLEHLTADGRRLFLAALEAAA